MTQWQYRHYLDHAALLASVRSSCWCDAQLELLDQLITRQADLYQQDAPASFDRQWWCDLAKQGFHRVHTTTNHDRKDQPDG